MTRPSEIDFSAEFGGRDAAAAVLQHFRLLKNAASETRLVAFPFQKLAFILRVDGEVATFGVRGASNIDIDKNGHYVSVDIGITVDDRTKLEQVITEAIRSCTTLLAAHADDRLRHLDGALLDSNLRALCRSYAVRLRDG